MSLRFLLVLGIGFVAGFAQAASKNVVLVIADDLGCDLGCYGNTVLKTPNLDALAVEGTLFTHAFCTTASCSPSRSVILSGMHNHANGMYGLQHAEHHFSSLNSVNSLPARLAKAGYRTAVAGKLHVGPDTVFPFGQVLKVNSRNTVGMAEACREVIEAQDERPFFLLVGYTDPHRSGSFGKGPLKPNRFGNEGTYPGIEEKQYDPREVLVPSFLPDTAAVRAELAEYYQSASRVDQGVGRLIQVLKNAGHWDDTLVVFISDNGIPFPGAKTSVYEPSLRLPCIVRSPTSSKRGVRSEAMVSWIDLTPTILEFAGQKHTGPKLHGRSFLSILDQEQPEGWDEVYASHTFHEVTMYYPMRVVRERNLKLIWNVAHALPFPTAHDLYQSATWQEALTRGADSVYGKRALKNFMHRPVFELYDLESDPDETRNLASFDAHREKLERLRSKLKQFQERTGDPWVQKWEHE